MAQGAGIDTKGNIFDLLESGQDVAPVLGQRSEVDFIDGLVAQDEKRAEKSARFAGSMPFGLEPLAPIAPEVLTENLSLAFKRTGDLAPDHVAEVRALSKQTSLPEPFVSANLPQVRDIAKYPDPGLPDLVQKNPGTALFLSDPANMALAKDDVAGLRRLEDSLSNLWPDVQAAQAARETSPWSAWDSFWQKNRPVDQRTGLPWMVSAPGQAWEASGQQDALAKAYTDLLLEGDNPALRERIRQMKLGQVQMPQAESYLGKILTGGASQTRQLLDLAPDAMKGGMVGYVGGYAATYAITKNPALAAQVGVQGAKLGGGMGAYKAMFELEGGGALEEYLGFTDAKTGQPIDFNLARGAAILTGAANAGIEAAEMAVLLEMTGLSKAVSGLTEATKRQFVKEAVVKGMGLPSTRALMMRIGAKGLGAWALESLQEGAQELVTIYFGEMAKDIHNTGEGQYIEPMSAEAKGTRVRDTIIDASASFLPLIGGGAAIGAYRNVRALAKARVAETKIQEFKDTLDAQRLAQRSPEAVEGAVRAMTGTPEGEAAPPLFISAQAFQGYFQQADAQDEAMRVLEVMGISTEDYEHALAVNGDLALPTDKVASSLAQGKHWDGLAPDLKVNTFDISAREALGIDLDAEQTRIQDLARAYDESQVPKEELDRLAGEFMASGKVSKNQAIEEAKLFGLISRTLTQSGHETPRQWFERNRIRIQADTLDAFRRRWGQHANTAEAGAAVLPPKAESPLAGLPDSSLSAAAEASGLYGEVIPLRIFTPEEQQILRDAGQVLNGESLPDLETGEVQQYEGVQAGAIFDERSRRSEDLRLNRVAVPISEVKGKVQQRLDGYRARLAEELAKGDLASQDYIDGLTKNIDRDQNRLEQLERQVDDGQTHIEGPLYQNTEDVGATPEERLAYFKDAKTRDAEGKLKVLYHGAQRADRIGDRFQKDRATSGPMAFFSDDPEVSSGYAQGKQDTSLEVDTLAEFFKVNGLDLRTAWLRTPPLERIRIKEMAHRIGLNEDTSEVQIVLRESEDSHGLAGRRHFEYELARAHNNAYQALFEMWVASGVIFGEEQKFLDVLRTAGVMDATFDDPYAEYPGVFPVYLNITKPLDTSNIPKKVVAALKKAAEKNPSPEYSGSLDGWDKRGPRGSGKEWFPYFEQGVKEGHTLAWTVVPDWVTATLKSLGYDGIKDSGGKFSARAHEVWIPFEENQVKSIFNQAPTSDPRLLYQTEAEGPRPWFASRLLNALADEKRLQASNQRNGPDNSFAYVIRADKGRTLTEKIMQALKSMQVPQDEIFWSGLEDHLAFVEAEAAAAGQVAQVTRQELLDLVDQHGSSFEDILLLSHEAKLLEIERLFRENIRQEAVNRHGAASPNLEALLGQAEITSPEVDSLLGETGLALRLYEQAQAEVNQIPVEQRVLPILDPGRLDENEASVAASNIEIERMAAGNTEEFEESARQRLENELMESDGWQEAEDQARMEAEQQAESYAQEKRDEFADELAALVEEQESVPADLARLYADEIERVRYIGHANHHARDFENISALYGEDVLALTVAKVEEHLDMLDLDKRGIEKMVAESMQSYMNNNINEREVEDYALDEAIQRLRDRNPVFYYSHLAGHEERWGVWVLDSEGDGPEYWVGTEDGHVDRRETSPDEALVRVARLNDSDAEMSASATTKYEQYKFEGGTNYRELLIRQARPEASLHYSNTHYGSVAQDVFGHIRIEDRVDTKGRASLNAIELQADAAQDSEKKGTYSQAISQSVSDEMAALDTWFQDQLTSLGKTGVMDLFVQAFREAGATDTRILDRIKYDVEQHGVIPDTPEYDLGPSEYRALLAAMPAPWGEKVMRYRFLARETSGFQEPGHRGIVPAMPFLDKPEALLVKRLVHYAVANDYPALTVSTGAHHTKRWGTPLIEWKTETEYAPPADLDSFAENLEKELAAALENLRTHPEPNAADRGIAQAIPVVLRAVDKLRQGPDIMAERVELETLRDETTKRMAALAKEIIANEGEKRTLGEQLRNSLIPLGFELMPAELRSSSSDAAHRASRDIHNWLESYSTGTTALPDYLQERATPEFMESLDKIRTDYLALRAKLESEDNDLFKQRHDADLEGRQYGNYRLHLDSLLGRAQVPGLYVRAVSQHGGAVFHEGRLLNLEDVQRENAGEMETRHGVKDAAQFEPFTNSQRLRDMVRGVVGQHGFSPHRFDQKIDAYTARVLSLMQKDPAGQFMPRKAGFEEDYDKRIKNLLSKIGKMWGAELTMAEITEERERRMRFEPQEPGFVPSLAHAAQFLDMLQKDGHIGAVLRDQALHAFSVGDGGHVEALWRLVAHNVHQSTLENYAYLLGGRVLDDYATVPVYRLALNEEGGLTPDQAAKVRSLVLEDRLPLYHGEGTVTRGAVHWEAGQTIVSLFEKANVTTGAHELGHIYLTELERLVELGEATAQQEKDLRIIREWAGEQGGRISEAGQEKFANGFLTYLREGKAPTEALFEIFAKFKRWITAVYKAARGAGVKINPEIRAVYDRMLATQEDMDGARNMYGLEPIFEGDTSLGESVATASEIEAYETLANRASLAADIEMQKYHEAERRKYRAQLVEQFDEQLKHNKAYRLATYLAYGYDPLTDKKPDRKAKDYKPGPKLNLESARYLWGDTITESVRPGLLSKDSAYTVEQSMIEFGFDSPEDVLGALQTKSMEARRNFVDSGLAQFDADWNEHGTPWANELQEKRLDAEARMLQRLARGFVPATMEGIKRLAARKVENMTVAQLQATFQNLKAAVAKVGKEIRQEKFLLAVGLDVEVKQAKQEQRAADQEKMRALRERWAERVAEANERRRVALAEIRERSKAREELAKLKGLSKIIFNSKKMDFDYREQAMAIVQRFGLGTPTMAPAMPYDMPPLLHFVQEKGIDVAALAEIPAWLFSEPQSGFRSVRTMTVAQMRELKSALSYLHFQGMNEKKMLGLAEDLAIADVAERSVITMNQLARGPKMFSERERQDHKTLVRARGLMAELGMVRYWADAADGFTNHGPNSKAGNTTTYLVHPFDLAESDKQDALRKMGDKLDRIFAPYRAQDLAAVFDIEGVPLLPAVAQEWGGKWDRQKVLMVALNMGNEGNIRALMGGYGWSYEHLAKITERLTPAEWRMVQEIWDTIDELYPLIDHVHRVVNGGPLLKVEALPLGTPAGHLRGGYFPLIFDHRLSDKAAFLGGLDKLMNEVETGAYADEIQHTAAVFRKSNPVNSFTKARKGSSLPPLLSLGVLSSHINSSLHFIHYGLPLRNAYKVVAVPEFRTAWVRALGEDSYMELGNWLRRQARPSLVMPGKFDKMFEKLRVLGSIQALGLSMQTALLQLSSAPMSWQEIGFGAFMKGAAVMAEHGAEAFAVAADLSAYMADRRHNLDSTMHDMVMRLELDKHHIALLKKVGLNLTVKDYQDFMFSWIQFVDALVAYPTWYGAYDLALNKRGLDPAAAVAFADEKVKRAQASGGIVDAPTFLRTAGAARLFSMFMSFSVNLLNSQAYFIRGWREGMISGRDFSRHLLLTWALPPVLASLMLAWAKGEPWPQFRDLFFDLFGYLLSGLPILREAVRSIEWGGRVGGSAALKPLEDIGKLSWRGVNLFDGKERDGEFLLAAQSLVDLIGFKAGIPTRPIWRLMQGVHDMAEGKTKNPMRLFFRAPKEAK